MSEQLKADFAKAQKLIKDNQHIKALAVLKPHKEHPRIATLIADLEARQKPKGGILHTVIWILVVIIVGVVAGVAGYGIGTQRTRSEYELPSSMEAAFTDICTANYDLSRDECGRGIRAKWYLYRGATQECYSLITDVPDLTERQFLECIASVGE